MGAARDGAADLVEMHLHGGSVGAGQHERDVDAVSGTDRAEQIGVLVALVGRHGLARASPRPDPGATVPLAQPGFIPRTSRGQALEPDFDRPLLGQVAYVGQERAREAFLNASRTGVSWPGCFGRPLMWENDSALSSSPIPRLL